METNVVDPPNSAQTVDLASIERKTKFSGTILKTTLAGAVVDIGIGIPGVIHISQLQEAHTNRVEDVVQVGQGVEVWVKRIDPKKKRIELTMIKPLDLEWREITKGLVIKGKVIRLEKFGAFVDIGAERPGLVHISEMTHTYIKSPGDVVKEGDEVDVQVLEVNRRKRQIKLSMKALEEKPVVAPRESRTRREKDKDKEKAAAARRKKVKAPRARGDAGGNVDELLATINEPAQEIEPTAMEIALREAMEKAKARKQDDKSRKNKSISQEQESILNRTLEGKAQS